MNVLFKSWDLMFGCIQGLLRTEYQLVPKQSFDFVGVGCCLEVMFFYIFNDEELGYFEASIIREIKLVFTESLATMRTCDRPTLTEWTAMIPSQSGASS